VRGLSGDPVLGELMVMNYRAARLSQRQRVMLDFAVKLTDTPWAVEEADREEVRRAGFTNRDIWDIAAVAAFFNMSNRVASATDMRPNSVYHGQARLDVHEASASCHLLRVWRGFACLVAGLAGVRGRRRRNATFGCRADHP